ncbi:MAG: hypothetical protein ACHQVS_03520 [Candidatus Babeliales bacterium]
MKRIVLNIALVALSATVVAPVLAWPNRSTRTITLQPGETVRIWSGRVTIYNGSSPRITPVLNSLRNGIKSHPITTAIIGSTIAGLVALKLYGQYVKEKLASENPKDIADVEKHNTFYSRVLGLYKSRNKVAAIAGLTAAVAAASAYYFGK